MPIDVRKHYENPVVQKEIAYFCRNRWVAIHCEEKTDDNRPLLVRYERSRPLTIESSNDVLRLLKRFGGLRPRTFYATASLYYKLKTKNDAFNYYENVYARTPTWDIDSKPEWWKATIKVIEIIVNALKDEGVSNSVYIKWSGRGAHVHIHENAISNEVYEKINPINAAYCIVDYIIKKIKTSILKINSTFNVEIKVENLMDPQRVFTAPLSLHKQLDVVCVAFKPYEIDDFDFNWTNPDNFKHNPNWREYDSGEADALAKKAYKTIGPYPKESKKNQKQLKLFKLHKQRELDFFIKPPMRHPSPLHFSLSALRFNPNPPPLNKGRKFNRGVKEAFLKIEDILSHFALGNIDLDHAVKALNYAKNAIIPFQNYSAEDIDKLITLYNDAINLLLRLKKPSEIKKWLLSNGPPRVSHIKLEDFFKQEE
ncbi:MAG: hypothetical protein NDF54_11190 [archaeon GB-1867-035]|nr:hypothetical protein [Candidatus Culexmicrobium profundum]